MNLMHHPKHQLSNHSLSALCLTLALLTLLPCSAAAQSQAGELQIVSETVEAGVVETRFDLEVDGVTVPGILWTPEGASGTRPLMAFGHGGTQHKRVSNILRMARDFVSNEYYAVVSIDAIGHGERASADQDPEERPAPNMTAEWMAVIDAVQALDHVGEGPAGYWGVSMGTRFGVPLIAEDSRIDAAVLGLFGLSENDGPTAWGDDVRRIDVPLIFIYQREDSLMTLQSGINLYDAFGSAEKSMHINPGGHVAVPVSEREKWKPFFVRHLGKAMIEQP